MSTDTSKGIPVPQDTDAFDVPGDLEKLADWVNANPGIGTYTTAERDVLVGADIWAGRVIFNTTTTQLEQNVTGTAGAAKWAPVTPADLAPGTPSMRTLGTGSRQAAAGDDARLSDQRTPTDGSVTDAKVAAANKDGSAGTPSMRTLGTGAQQAAAGNHKHTASDTNSGTFDIARLPVAPSGTSSTTQVPRADDARLSDQRTPTDGSVTDAKVAAANKDGVAATPSLRTLGTGTRQAAAGNHTHDASTLTGTLGNAQLPARLGIAAQTITDWNDATYSGWYLSTPSALNSPIGSYMMGQVFNDGTTLTQSVHAYGQANATSQRWQRNRSGGTWSAWEPVLTTQTQLDNRYATSESPVLTGSPKAVTRGTSDNTTNIATTAFVQALLANKVTAINAGGNYIVIGSIKIAWSTSNISSYSPTNVSFPAGGFSAPPVVLASLVGGNAGDVQIMASTGTSVPLAVNLGPANSTYSVSWIAIGQA